MEAICQQYGQMVRISILTIFAVVVSNTSLNSARSLIPRRQYTGLKIKTKEALNGIIFTAGDKYEVATPYRLLRSSDEKPQKKI